MSRIPNFASTCTNTGCFVWWAGGGTGVRSHGTGPDRRCAQTPWSPLSDQRQNPRPRFLLMPTQVGIYAFL